MSTDEVSKWLSDGLAAATTGNRVLARELLQRVVDADENNVQGWLWLSGVVNTLEDREVCLANVLTLDPANEAARKGLAWVREQIAATPEIEPESALPHVEPDKVEDHITANFSDGEFDSPWLCVFCGQLTSEDDKRCPNCKNDLYNSVLKSDRPKWILPAWIISLVDAAMSIMVVAIAIMALMLALVAARLNVGTGGPANDVLQIILLYLGQPTSLTAPAQALILTGLPRAIVYFRSAYAVFTLVIAFGLLTRRRPFHILFAINMVVGVVGAFLAFNFSPALKMSGIDDGTPISRIMAVVEAEGSTILVKVAQIFGGVAILIVALRLLLFLLMEEDFEQVTERLWSVIDHTVREPSTAFVRAKTYMKRDMWTLAALYLRRCLSMQSNVPEYHLALAEAYAHLGRYQQGLTALDQADRLQPDAPITHNLRGVILDLQARSLAAPAPEKSGGL